MRRALEDVPKIRNPTICGVAWSRRLDSNQRPPAPEAGALPGCATPRNNQLVSIEPLCSFVYIDRLCGLIERGSIKMHPYAAGPIRLSQTSPRFSKPSLASFVCQGLPPNTQCALESAKRSLSQFFALHWMALFSTLLQSLTNAFTNVSISVALHGYATAHAVFSGRSRSRRLFIPPLPCRGGQVGLLSSAFTLHGSGPCPIPSPALPTG